MLANILPSSPLSSSDHPSAAAKALKCDSKLNMLVFALFTVNHEVFVSSLVQTSFYHNVCGGFDNALVDCKSKLARHAV